MLKSRRFLPQLFLVALACAPDRALSAEPAKVTPAGTRVTALVRAVRFPVPGSPARVTLSPGSSVVVFPGNQAETARVLVEEGGALLDVPASAPALVLSAVI